jgi:integrase
MADYLANTHGDNTNPQAPLWPRRAMGGARRKGEPVVPRLDWAKPCDLRSVHDDIIAPALEAVGLPASRPVRDGQPATRGVRLHDFRHTFAALQLTAGVHFMQVSKWLGHASYSVTMAVYADWIPEEAVPNALPEPVAAPTPNVVNLWERSG